MKYIYGLNKSGISILNYFNEKKLSFSVWDDNSKQRKKISNKNKKILFKKPESLNFLDLEEAYITPGLDLKNDKLTNKDLINFMVENPKLIERPIVVRGDKAVIGRPPENVLSLV